MKSQKRKKERGKKIRSDLGQGKKKVGSVRGNRFSMEALQYTDTGQ